MIIHLNKRPWRVTLFPGLIRTAAGSHEVLRIDMHRRILISDRVPPARRLSVLAEAFGPLAAERLSMADGTDPSPDEVLAAWSQFHQDVQAAGAQGLSELPYPPGMSERRSEAERQPAA